MCKNGRNARQFGKIYGLFIHLRPVGDMMDLPERLQQRLRKAARSCKQGRALRRTEKRERATEKGINMKKKICAAVLLLAAAALTVCLASCGNAFTTALSKLKGELVGNNYTITSSTTKIEKQRNAIYRTG